MHILQEEPFVSIMIIIVCFGIWLSYGVGGHLRILEAIDAMIYASVMLALIILFSINKVTVDSDIELETVNRLFLILVFVQFWGFVIDNLLIIKSALWAKKKGRLTCFGLYSSRLAGNIICAGAIMVLGFGFFEPILGNLRTIISVLLGVLIVILGVLLITPQRLNS